MKVNFDNELNVMNFTNTENEKVFCLIGTKFADGGENSVMLLNEEEIKQFPTDGWSIPFNEMEVGDTSIHGYWYYDKANIVTRLA